MQIQKKYIIIISGTVILFILSIVLYFLFFVGNKKKLVENNNNNNNNVVSLGNNLPAGNNTINKKNNTKIITNKNNLESINKDNLIDKKDYQKFDTTEDDLMQMASSFAERFGSYSNQSNFSNMIDLKIFMTKKMSDWVKNYIREKRKESGIDSIYYGITTKAVLEDIIKFDDEKGEAEILVKTRRREAINTTDNISKVFDQDININFKKENEIWRVDSANWTANLD